MKKFIILIFIGIIIRLGLVIWSFQFPQNPDLLRHREWGQIAYFHGISNTYNKEFIKYGIIPNNLPPGNIYVINTMYNIQLQVSKVILKITKAPEGSSLLTNIYILDLFLKLPSILAELVMAICIYKIVKKQTGEKKAILASSLILFNPVFIYNSAVWGQIDALNNMLFIISLYFLFQHKLFLAANPTIERSWMKQTKTYSPKAQSRIPWASAQGSSFLTIFFCIFSLFFKLTLFPVILIVIASLFLSDKNQIKKILKYLFLSLILMGLLILPISIHPGDWLPYFVINNLSGESQYITVNAFNFWFALFKPFIGNGKFPSVQNIYLGVSLGVWASLVFLVFITPVVRKILLIRTHQIKKEYLILILALISLIIFIFAPKMHERYLYPFFPLFALYIGLTGKFLKTFLVLSTAHIFNLLFVWHPMVGYPQINIFGNNTVQWLTSLLICLSGFYLYFKSFSTTE